MIAPLVGLLGRVGHGVLLPIVTATGLAHLLLATVGSAWGQRRAAQISALAAVVTQVRAMGVRTLGAVVSIGFLVGLIGAVQLVSLLLPILGRERVWPILAAILVRELAPLLTAVLVASRSGAIMAYELAHMNVADELDALQTMGVNPLHCAVLPRVVALVVSTLVLSFSFVVAAILGCGFVADFSLSIPPFLFLDYFLSAITPDDINLFAGKALGFGLLIAAVAARAGLGVGPAAEQIPVVVSRATFHALAACVLFDALLALLQYFRPAQLYALFQ